MYVYNKNTVIFIIVKLSVWTVLFIGWCYFLYRGNFTCSVSCSFKNAKCMYYSYAPDKPQKCVIIEMNCLHPL